MVTGTEYTIRDAAGNALCHSAGASKMAADSKRKRAVRAAFLDMCEAAGIVDDMGMVRDVVTGAFMPMADADTEATEWDVIERGHVVADVNGGAFCPCNLVPQNREHNKRNDGADLDPDTFKVDPRMAWRDVWTRHVPAFKVARAIA